jgi:hypothetical protein
MALPVRAAAVDDITLARRWQLVDQVDAGDCRAEIIGNGQFYRISGLGFRPEERVDYRLVNDAVEELNGRIPPVEYRLKARADGSLQQFYIPFVPNRTGGRVAVSLTSASCSLQLGFTWQRRGA